MRNNQRISKVEFMKHIRRSEFLRIRAQAIKSNTWGKPLAAENRNIEVKSLGSNENRKETRAKWQGVWGKADRQEPGGKRYQIFLFCLLIYLFITFKFKYDRDLKSAIL